MAELVSAYTDESSNTVVTISKALAESSGVKVLKSDPLDRNGRPLAARTGYRETSAKKAANTTTTGGSSASKPEEGTK